MKIIDIIVDVQVEVFFLCSVSKYDAHRDVRLDILLCSISINFFSIYCIHLLNQRHIELVAFEVR